MVTTLFFVQFIGFWLCYATSKQVKHQGSGAIFSAVAKNQQRYRYLGVILLLIASSLFVWQWGIMTGLCASIIGFMGVASLIVLLSPFNYFTSKTLILLYVLFFTLELIL